MERKDKPNSIIKSLLSVSVVVAAAKVVGLIKQIVTAGVFGATIKTDIIMLSEGLVSNLDYLLVQALSTAFIPTYIVIKTECPEKCKRFVSNTLKFFLLITVIISLAILLGAPVIAKILAPTYTGDLSKQLARYLRIVAPILIIIVELAVFNSLLKANEHFIPGELVGLNQSVILILLVFLIGGRFGADTLVIGFYSYALFNLFFLMLASRQYWCIIDGNPFVDENVRKLLTMMGPLLLGYSMVFVNQQVDKIIVSGLGEGTVTAMSYAAVLSNFISTFIGSICGVLFTYVTQHIAEKKDEEAAALTTTALIQLITLLIPIMALTAMNAGDIASAVFGRGKFGGNAIRNCSLALTGYACMFVPFAARELSSRFQYGYGDSRRPMINSTIGIGFNIIASIVLSRFWGVFGVTFATSISVLLSAVLNVLSSRKRNHYLKMKPLLEYIPHWVGGAAICIIFSIFGKKMLVNTHSIIRFVVIALASILGYIAINFSLIRSLFNRLFNKAQRMT